jgi:hypothetical protein
MLNGPIKIMLPHRVLQYQLTLDNITDTLKRLYKNTTALQDELIRSNLLNITSCPLTILYAHQTLGLKFKDQTVVHLVGKL